MVLNLYLAISLVIYTLGMIYAFTNRDRRYDSCSGGVVHEWEPEFGQALFCIVSAWMIGFVWSDGSYNLLLADLVGVTFFIGVLQNIGKRNIPTVIIGVALVAVPVLMSVLNISELSEEFVRLFSMG
jgi:hypothetical protein